MKKFRKMIAVVLAITVAMTMGIATSSMAFAADKNDSITVKSAKAGETYSVYKLFDLSVNDESEPTAYSYTINSAWAAFFAQDDVKNLITKNDAGYVTAITESNAAIIAEKAAAYAKANSMEPVQSKVAEGTTVVFTGLADGYWLVTSTLGNKAMIETTPDKSAVEVNEKNPDNTIEKTVKEDSSGNYGESNDVQVGDTVDFKSVATIQPKTRNVKIVDTMDSGLDYVAESVAIAGLTKGTDYTVEESAHGFTISIKENYIAGLTAAAELTITYQAKVNAAAVVSNTNGVAIVDQKNKTKVTYGDGTSSTEDETTTTTHKFEVLKYAGGSSAKDNLADAVFQLKKGSAVVNLIKIDATNYRVADATEAAGTASSHANNGEINTIANGTLVSDFVTVASGNIVIWGVDSDEDYKLHEVQAPKGYNELTSDKDVTVAAANNTVAEVENNAGTELPSTGGIGTTIFYILGALLVVGCGIILIARRRMSAHN